MYVEEPKRKENGTWKELASGICTVNVPPTSKVGGVELVVKLSGFVVHFGPLGSSCLDSIDSEMYAMCDVPEEAETGRLVWISRLGAVYVIVVLLPLRGGVLLSLLITLLTKSFLVIVLGEAAKISL